MRMAAGTDEVVAIPVDADARISKPFVTAIERDVLINLSFVRVDISLHSFEGRLFFDRKHEYEIAFRFDFRRVQRANRRQQGFNIPRVVANSRRINLAVTYLCLDRQSRLKNCVHMSIEHSHRLAGSALAHGDEVAGWIVMHIIEMILAQETFDVLCALLLMS